MEIKYFDELPSTHTYLIEKLKNDEITSPCAILANRQTQGIGSRGNSWEGMDENLFLSFCIKKESLPSDLPIASMSIYFAYQLKELLEQLGSSVWLKWPNDFYIDDKKVGGMITSVIKDEIVICSVGINLKKAPKKFQIIDINIDNIELTKKYLSSLKSVIFWKEIFRKYQVEFNKSRHFFYYDEEVKKKVSLEDAKLLEDGSIVLNHKRKYSLR